MSANEDVEMRDVEDEEDDEEQVALDLDPDEGSSVCLLFWSSPLFIN
jgi:hypothetical protein